MEGQHRNVIIKVLDGGLYYLILSFGILVGVPFLWLRRTKPNAAPLPEPRKLLYFQASSLDAVEKIQSRIFFESDLDGFFQQVHTVFFVPGEADERSRKFSDTHIMYQYPQRPRGRLRRLGLWRCNTLWGLVRVALGCNKLITQEGCNLLRAQDPHLTGLLAFALASYHGLDYAIHMVQNYDISYRNVQKLAFPPFRLRWLELLLERMVISRACLVTSSYANYRYYALSHGARPESTFRLKTGLDPVHFIPPKERHDPRAEMGLLDNRILFYVGRMEEMKYTQDVVECAVSVCREFPDLIALFVGDGAQKSKLEAMVKREPDLEERIRFLGTRPQDEVAALLATSDVVVFAHAGITLLEAAFAEAPIVVYDHDWHGEFLGYNERGRIADFRDVKGMIAEVFWVLNNPEEASQVATCARRFALEHFNRDAIVGRERQVFERWFLDGSSRAVNGG